MCKKGLKLECSNYRQTFLLTYSDEITERLLYDRFFSFIEEKELLYSTQFGF